MKLPFAFFIVVALISCTHENTDLSVKANITPVQFSIGEIAIPPPLDTLMFNRLALDCFFHMGYSTGGEFYFKTAAESVHETIIQILQDHGRNGSDIVFLIDKTGSMANDIDSVRINLNLIIDQIEKLENVRLGVAAYGDRIVDGTSWFEKTELSETYESTRNFINGLKVSNGGDYPESVYDGLAEVIQTMNWRTNVKKTILVIGDAPSLEDSLSNYNREELIDLCRANDVQANIFPVLVTPWSSEAFVEYSAFNPKMISRIYPNPASKEVNLEMNAEDNYQVTLFDLSGIVAWSGEFYGTHLTIPISESIAPGQYILRTLSKTDMMFNSEKITIV